MPLNKQTTYSIVVPLFNERENVHHLIDEVFRVAEKMPERVELVLVDDGSSDETFQMAADRAAADSRIVVVQHEHNRGLGAAIRTGIKRSTGERVLYTDADLPFDFDLIPGLFARSGDDKVLSGFRLNRGEGAKRLILTKGYNFGIRMIFGLKMNDVNFACKVFPRRFVDEAVLQSEGSFIDVEMLLEVKRLGLRIVEEPLVYLPRERGVSTLSRPAVVFGIVKELASHLSLAFRHSREMRRSGRIAGTGFGSPQFDLVNGQKIDN